MTVIDCVNHHAELVKALKEIEQKSMPGSASHGLAIEALRAAGESA